MSRLSTRPPRPVADRTGVNLVPLAERRAPERKPGRIPWFGVVPALIVAALFTIGPLVIIVMFSFMSRPPQGGGVVYEFSLEPYMNFLFQSDFVGNTQFDPRYLKVFGDSLLQAAITTAVCLVLSFPIALWIATRSAKLQNVLVLLITIPFWTNLLVRTYAWMLILNDNGIVNKGLQGMGLPKLELLYTPLASQLGLIYTFLPFMVLPIYSSLAGFDFRLAEAAYDLGAKKTTVMRRIILPLAVPGVISGVLLVFMPAFGSYVQPVLLGGGNVLLIGNLIASQFGDARNWPFGAALSVVILIMLMIALLAVALYSRKSGKKVEITL
ncbi:ABC transporter permease [Leucobacter sp. cx-42]|uniref:ABC transporter permease n=1 Tax=unclassified Leucobacter TaxID=2621730 RepID=UPI00165E19CA|nr:MULTISPECIES: ABC transporter permease [unclassified Leucobacter]MBC9953770.1 ABC transporter permease [Leucobacter sp. cx-42]